MFDLHALTLANGRRCLLTAERLREVLTYDPGTGLFVRNERTSNAVKIGDSAGCVNRNGYRYIEVCGERFLAQRLAWFYMTGSWPADEIDHKDCDRDNNSWVNLRQATRIQNLANARMKSANTTGFKGITFSKHRSKYVARIRHAGKRLSLGYFDTPECAHAAYAKKAAELHGEFARAA